MDNKENLDFGTVSSKKIEAIISKLKRDKKIPEEESIEIPFSVLVISCFPNLWKTFDHNIKKIHQDGYVDGYNYGREECREKILEEVEKWTKRTV